MINADKAISQFLKSSNFNRHPSLCLFNNIYTIIVLAQVSITIDTHLHIELEVKHCSIVRTVWMFMDILWLVGLLFKQVLRTVADNFVKIFSIKSVLCLFYWRQVSSHQQHGHGSAQILINILSNATGAPQTLFVVHFNLKF